MEALLYDIVKLIMGESFDGNLDGYVSLILIAVILGLYIYVQLCIAIDRAVRKKKSKSISDDVSPDKDKKGAAFVLIGAIFLPVSFLLFLEHWGLLSQTNYSEDIEICLTCISGVLFFVGLALYPVGFDRIKKSDVAKALFKTYTAVMILSAIVVLLIFAKQQQTQ